MTAAVAEAVNPACIASERSILGVDGAAVRRQGKPASLLPSNFAGATVSSASSSKNGREQKLEPGLIVIRGDEVEEKPLRWTWEPYLPLGKLVHFGGNSSQAKSPVTIDLAARISVGTQWLDGT